MASCDPFTFTFQGLVDDLINRANDELTTAGGTLTRDSNSGSFIVPIPLVRDIKGTYFIIDQEITIEIKSRPGLIGCGRIQSEIEERL